MVLEGIHRQCYTVSINDRPKDQTKQRVLFLLLLLLISDALAVVVAFVVVVVVGMCI